MTPTELYSSYSSLKNKLISLRARKEAVKESLNNSQLALTQEEQTLSNLNATKVNLYSSITVFKQLMDVLSQEQINQLKDLLTYGLKTIFSDRNYSIDIVLSESRNVKQATFFLVETLRDGTVIKSEFKDSIGGGVMAVVGLLIQIYYISYYSQYPIIFMDEALSQVSSQYLPTVMQFLDLLASQKHFHFVLVTHDQRIMDYGKRVYLVNEGVVTKIRG